MTKKTWVRCCQCFCAVMVVLLVVHGLSEAQSPVPAQPTISLEQRVANLEQADENQAMEFGTQWSQISADEKEIADLKAELKAVEDGVQGYVQHAETNFDTLDRRTLDLHARVLVLEGEGVVEAPNLPAQLLAVSK